MKIIGLKKYEKLMLNSTTKKNYEKKVSNYIFISTNCYSQMDRRRKNQVKTSMKYKKSSINIGIKSLMKKVKVGNNLNAGRIL